MRSIRHIAHVVATTGAAVPRYRVELRVGSHQLVADEPPVEGGGDTGPNPFGLLLAGLASCTATTLRIYASRKGWDLATIEVDVRYDIADGAPASIARTITLPDAMPAEQRARLADIAERTPVTLALRAGTQIDTTVRIDAADSPR